MDSLKPVIGMVRFIGQNFAYNLDKVPDHRLNWKPSATANSALEIVGHSAHAFRSLRARIRNEAPPEASPPPSTREEAKTLILNAANGYAEWLEGLTPGDLEGEVTLRMGVLPRERAILLPVTDLIHHHGQICYLQTIWGDVETHFFVNGS